MFLVPARFIFGGPPLFFYICYWKSWNEQNPTFVTALNTNQSSTIQRNRRYFSFKEPFIKYLVLLTSSFWRTLPIEMYRKTYQQQNNRKL